MPPNVEPRVCKWHNCTKGPAGARGRFTPARTNQEFCSTQCRGNRAAWRQTRGSVLVDPLLNEDWEALKELRAQIKREIDQ